MSVEVIRATSLGEVPHGFLGRRGGVSTGICEGLNVGTGSNDDREAIAENRRRAAAAVLEGAALATVHQVHSAEAVFVEAPWEHDDRPKADAMVTDRPGILLGILTADCVPVLLADAEAGVVAAAHAGWRGALAGVTDSTIALMEQHGAVRDRITAAIGPAIACESYEVGGSLADEFLWEDPSNSRFFAGADDEAGETHAYFDLPAYVAHRLLLAGVGTLERLALDTYANPDRFFSYRRATHDCEPDYGRQISLIGLAV